jgi:hypothetical protein
MIFPRVMAPSSPHHLRIFFLPVMLTRDSQGNGPGLSKKGLKNAAFFLYLVPVNGKYRTLKELREK